MKQYHFTQKQFIDNYKDFDSILQQVYIESLFDDSGFGYQIEKSNIPKLIKQFAGYHEADIIEEYKDMLFLLVTKISDAIVSISICYRDKKHDFGLLRHIVDFKISK